MDTRLRTLLAGILRTSEEKIGDDLAMKDSEAWDSLKHMDLVMSLEQTFDIQLTFDEIVQMQNLREIKRVLRERGVTG